MGKVWRVLHTGWNTELAMKQPKANLFQTERQKENFVRECEAWINLGLHPHIVSCYYVRDIAGIPTIFSEWMDCGSLKDVIENGSLYTGSEVAQNERILDTAIQFARGLDYAHEQGLIHQDVKPDNLLLNKEGEAKVADFGIAKARASLSEAQKDTPADATMFSDSGGYTPAYCSIEQMNGEKLTRRTDIYSWAVSVMEMYLGERPWQNGVIAGAACESYFPKARVNIPDGMRELLRECLNADEARRPYNFADIEKWLLCIFRDTTGNEYARTEPQSAADTADSMNNRALSFLDMGKSEEAERFWEKALALNPNHEETIYNSALHLWRSGKIDDMEAVLRVETSMNNNQTWQSEYNLARVYLESGDGEHAAPLFKSALEKSGGNSAVKDTLEKSADQSFNWRATKVFERHSGQVYSVCFSPNGKYVLSGAKDQTVKLWDIKSGDCMKTLSGHSNMICSVCFSPDGDFILSGSSDEKLKLWDAATGECRRTLTEEYNSVGMACFSPDGNTALSCGGSKIKLWDMKTGEKLSDFTGHSGVEAVCFSPDGKYALSGGLDSNSKLWDISNGDCLRTFIGHSKGVNAVCFSSDGKFALSSGNYEKTLKLWDVSTGECLRTYSGHTDAVSFACISPNDKIILSGSHFEKSLRLWNIDSGQCLRTFKILSNNMQTASFSPEGFSILSGGSDGVCVLHSIPRFTYRAQWELCKISSVREILEKEHLSHVIEESIEEAIRKKDIHQAIRALHEMDNISGFNNTPSYISLNTKIGRFCRVKGIRFCELIATYKGHPQNIQMLTFNGQSMLEASSGYDDKISVWDIASEKLLCTCEGYPGSIYSACFSPDSKHLISGSETLRLWDIRTGECLHTFDLQDEGISALSYSSNGKFVLSASYSGALKLWDVETGECLHTFTDHSAEVRSACFSPDGRHVLSACMDNTLKLLDIKTGDCVRTFVGHGWGVTSNCMVPNSSFMLSCSADETLKLWDIETGTCLRTYAGHKSGVQKLCVSPNGSFAFSAGSFDTLKLWDLASGECLRTFNGNYKKFTSICFSPDGQYVMAGSEDGTIRLWQLDYEYEFPGWTDWDEGARPSLENFIALNPHYTEADFDSLIIELQNRSFGWLKSEGVRAKLEEMQPKKKVLFSWIKK